MATIKENLIAAKALIEDEANWGKFSYARPNGCMCAIGALAKAMGLNPLDETPPYLGAIELRLDQTAVELGFTSATDLNDADTTTHADVMALFDRAIAAQDGAA